MGEVSQEEIKRMEEERQRWRKEIKPAEQQNMLKRTASISANSS